MYGFSDPAIKNKVHNKLAEDGHSPEVLFQDMDSPPPPPQHHPPPLEMVTRTNTNKVEVPKYEAFMMTGERVIKMSKNTQVKYIFFLFPPSKCYIYLLF
jgi:hypothetical protein